MPKKTTTATILSQEMDRLIRERARGPYSRYFNSSAPVPVPLSRRDESGCNWTVVSPPTQQFGSLPFLDLIISKLMCEYDLIPG